MLSVGSRDGIKRLGLEMEVEEGEALSYNNNNDGGGIEEDPDIALSYIEEKIQNVLGHFQKDFEGGVVSAENLGAKFGGYGSFLPTYQRSPSWSHAKSQQEVHNSDSPRKLHLEDRKQSLLAQSSASPSLRSCDASVRTSSMGNSLKGDAYLPSRHTEEPVSKRGVLMKSINPSDQRSLKVRLKVGSENLSTQKNVDIYSGLGLVSPSSSLDDSPSTSEQQSGKVSDAPDESPSSILEIMTAVHSDLLLSPLAKDLIHLTEKRKHKVKSESGIENKPGIESLAVLSNGFHANMSNQKVKEHRILKSSEKYDAVSNKTSYQKNYADQNDTGYLLKKEKEPDINALGYDQLVANALKLPLLSSPYNSADDPAKVMSTPTNFPVIAPKEKKQLHNESLKDIGIFEKLGGRTGSSSKAAVSTKGNTTDNAVPYAQQDILKTENDQFKQRVVQKGGQDSGECLNPAPENSSTGGKKKPKRAQDTTAQCSHVPDNQLVSDFSVTSKRDKGTHANGILSKTDSHDPHQRDHKKPGDRYKDFFGDIEFGEDDNESISGEMALKDSQQVENTGFNERHSASSEKFDVKKSEKLQQPEDYPRAARAQVAAPPLENGTGSELPAAMDNPLVNEQWVLCDKCGRWRLLPLGTNPKSLPDKWICRMLTWLPGMNRCNIPEDVTTTALRALYHPVPSVPAAVPSSVLVTSGDAINNEERQHAASQNAKIGRKKKHGAASATYSNDIDGSTHSSNSRKKNLPASGRNSSLNMVNPSPVLDACGYQQTQQTNGDIVDKPNDDKKDGNVSRADKGINLKIRSLRESDLNDSRVSKRIKGEELRDDENWTSDNGHGYNSDLATNSSRNGRVKYTNRTDPRGDPKESTVSLGNQEMPAPGDNLLRSGKSNDKKRKRKEYRDSRINATPLLNSAMCENVHQNEKKARVTNSRAANSSSSKVSGSHKNKTSTEDVKGSPVESVSSSPLRLPNHKSDKVKSSRRTLVEKDDIHDSESLTVASSRNFSGIEGDEGKDCIGIVEKNSAPPANNLGTYYASEKRSSDKCQVEEMILNNKKLQNNGSHSKKSGKRPSSHSKNKSHTSKSDVNEDKMKASDTPLSQDKSNIRRSKLDGKSGTPGKSDKFLVKKDTNVQGTSVQNSKGQREDVINSQDKKHKLDKELYSEKLPKKINQAEAKKSHSLPPLARSQGETVPEFGSKKQNGIKISAIDALDNGDGLKVTNQSKKAQNQNGQPITSRQPSPLPRESSTHAANSAIKEAKDLKHLADRLKNNGPSDNGSSESIGYYFQAVLKFLHGASLLESGSSEGTKQNDVAHAMHIYSSTAKLCDYCAREYEKSKDMAAAALAYKCTEVAHMRVVYSSHTSAIRDRNELQTALQVVPPGESPSSSASDVDNLNHQSITDKGPLAKVLGSPQVSGSHVISSRNRAGFLRLLNYAQEVNFAMEAARKSRIAYTAVSSRVGEAPQREGVDSLKEVLDFSFQDVEGLLRLVRVAMEVISR